MILRGGTQVLHCSNGGAAARGGMHVLSSNTRGARRMADCRRGPDAAPAGVLAVDYHPAVGGMLNQQGVHLGWAIGGAMGGIGGLADLGDLLFVTALGYAFGLPGTVLAIVLGNAIVLSGGSRRGRPASRERG